jgi:hypothetical protein
VFGLVKALRREGIQEPWKLAWTIVKSRFLPHRTYLWSDHDGFVYDPVIKQWNLGPWKIWEDSRERRRQKTRAGQEVK